MAMIFFKLSFLYIDHKQRSPVIQYTGGTTIIKSKTLNNFFFLLPAIHIK